MLGVLNGFGKISVGRRKNVQSAARRRALPRSRRIMGTGKGKGKKKKRRRSTQKKIVRQKRNTSDRGNGAPLATEKAFSFPGEGGEAKLHKKKTRERGGKKKTWHEKKESSQEKRKMIRRERKNRH